MVLCTVKTWFSHDPLPQGEICPYCKTTAPAPTTPATASSVVSAPAMTTTSTIISAARYSTNPITAISKSRALAIARARAPLPTPDRIRLALKVAHAIIENDRDPPSIRQFIEGWQCGIMPSKTFSTGSLTAHLVADARALLIPTGNWNEAVYPPGEGQWRLATNELAKTKPSPQMIRAWPEEMTIQDIIDLQDYCLSKRATAYPVTLIWYTTRVTLDGIKEEAAPSPSLPPPPDHITISDNDTLPSLASLLGIPKHKRTISEAIPDRDKGRHDFHREGTPFQALWLNEIKKEEGDDETEQDNVQIDNDKAKRGKAQVDDDEAERGKAQVDDDKAERGKAVAGNGQRRSRRARKATAKASGDK
jgi:hypothetical protein